eukprot:TRINITY_DN32328_c0_g1_i1.p1 TRINITY_DN32328_c0_g1~~TRINITY_DN32328_c0_g1_i1.p1  ORF type:complete len:117 (-),score=33.89 TRINITY_DN32328_c0_g1_i1:134-460(-)
MGSVNPVKMMRSLVIIILLGHLDVQSKTTLKIQEDINVKQFQQHACRTDDKEYDIANKNDRTFSTMVPDQFWDDAIVPWSFVQNTDGLSSVSVHTDPNVGLWLMILRL